MKFTYKIAALLFLQLLLRNTFAQQNDSLSLQNSQYNSILSSDSFFLDVLFYKIDNDVLINNLGPFGSSNYYSTVFGLNGINRFYLNSKSKSIISSIEGIKPFTNISYINASRKEQIISVNHFQKLGKSVTFSFDYTKLSSPGSYLNQEANNTLFDVFVGYKSRNDLYDISFSSFIDRKLLQENGGLLNPIDFENNLYSNRRSYNVNLPTSHSSKKDQEYNVNQRLNVFSFENDTIIYKSISLGLKSQYFSSVYVFHDDDPLSSIYSSNFIDTLATVDSIYTRNISNQLSINYQCNAFDFSILSEHDHVDYNQNYGIDTSYNDVYTGFWLKSNFDKHSFIFKADYVFAGYRKADINTDLSFDYVFNSKVKLNFSSSFHLNEPALMYVTYYSNHYKWSNFNFKKQSVISNQLCFDLTKVKTQLSIENKMFSDFLYLDSNSNASQYNPHISVSTFKVSQDYRLLNFHFRTAVLYQLTTNDVLVPLPEFIGRQLLYFENYMFKKALKFQIGANLTFKTSFYGYAYTPALNEFNTQTTSLIGNYPLLDIFINTRLKRAQIFFKYEHFNSGWNGYKYYSTPGYPRLDKSFKFGVSWNMFD